MIQKTVIQTFRISVDQWATLKVLDCYKINVSEFIRQAISEKLKKDWPVIKEKQEKIKIPF